MIDKNKYNYKLLLELLDSNIMNKEIYERIINELKNVKYNCINSNGVSFICTKVGSNCVLKIDIINNITNNTKKILLSINKEEYNYILDIKHENNFIFIEEIEKFGWYNLFNRKKIYNDNNLVYEELFEKYEGNKRYNKLYIIGNKGIKMLNQNNNIYYYLIDYNDTILNYDTRINDNNTFSYISKSIEKQDYDNNLESVNKDILNLTKFL